MPDVRAPILGVMETAQCAGYGTFAGEGFLLTIFQVHMIYEQMLAVDFFSKD